MDEINDSTHRELPEGISESVDLVQILLWVLNGKKLILLTMVVFGLVGIGLALTQKNVYTANTEILPPRGSIAQTMMGPAGGMGAVSAASFSSMASALEGKMAADTFSAVLNSRPVQDDLINRFDLKNVYKARTMSDARMRLASATGVTATKENFVIITVTDVDAQRATVLANGYIDSLRQMMHRLALTQSSQRRLFLEAQVNKSKEDLTLAEANFKQMQQTNHIISVDAQSKALIDSAAAMKAQIASKEVQLEGLRSYSTEQNPQVQILEKELSAMRSQEASMDQNSDNTYSDIGLSSVPNASLSFLRAQRDLRYQEELFSLLMKQYGSARIDEAQDAPMLQVIEPAIVPETKSGPKRALMVLGATALGLFVGVVWSLFLGWKSEWTAEGRATLARLRNSAFSW